jgi:two-component system sensor histidine kinase RegB
MTSSSPPDSGFLSTPAIAFRWVLRLRWAAIAGQLATILGASVAFRLRLPLVPLACIVGVTAATNLALVRWMAVPRSVSPGLVAAVLAFDTGSLGALLYFTGGPSNPFSVLFLVQVTIAALVIGAKYTSGIVILSVCTYALLFFDNMPLAGMQHMHHGGAGAFDVHLQGMFAAFTLAAGLIGGFVTRVSSALRERDAQLVAAQRSAATNERLVSLSTLSAGAAHELGTPLATIAVAANELERAAQRFDGAEVLRDDARLIRRQVDRCREIVHGLGARSGSALGEAPELVEPIELIRQIRAYLDDARAERLEIQATEARPLKVPPRGLAQAVGSLVRNALDASTDDTAPIRVTIETKGRRARFSVVDRGHGIAPDDLPHIGEPFYTKKPPGTGMGLGVFLARAFADRLGGSLVISSDPGQGTCAVMELPIEEA